MLVTHAAERLILLSQNSFSEVALLSVAVSSNSVCTDSTTVSLTSHVVTQVSPKSSSPSFSSSLSSRVSFSTFLVTSLECTRCPQVWIRCEDTCETVTTAPLRLLDMHAEYLSSNCRPSTNKSWYLPNTDSILTTLGRSPHIASRCKITSWWIDNTCMRAHSLFNNFSKTSHFSVHVSVDKLQVVLAATNAFERKHVSSVAAKHLRNKIKAAVGTLFTH
mmetsp:Transcript_11697/g.21737  ORF Transcript_11697/g.21737 Transcript_11697/m.21737 type:complete len:219 (+) Transcript_11697:384-1040(+)